MENLVETRYFKEFVKTKLIFALIGLSPQQLNHEYAILPHRMLGRNAKKEVSLLEKRIHILQ